MRFFILTSSVLLLFACADNSKDYGASAKCQGMGYAPGTAEYDKCVEEEKIAKAMQQQREEFEQMKQYQQDQKLKHY
jgi:hypothetical protein